MKTNLGKLNVKVKWNFYPLTPSPLLINIFFIKSYFRQERGSTKNNWTPFSRFYSCHEKIAFFGRRVGDEGLFIPLTPAPLLINIFFIKSYFRLERGSTKNNWAPFSRFYSCHEKIAFFGRRVGDEGENKIAYLSIINIHWQMFISYHRTSLIYLTKG